MLSSDDDDDDTSRCMIMMKSKVHIEFLSDPAMAAPEVASHVLQEPDIPMLSKDIPGGRAIKGSNLFSPQREAFKQQQKQKQKQQRKQQQQQKQQNGDSPSTLRLQNHHVHHNFQGRTPSKGSPENHHSNLHKPGKNHSAKINESAPHYGPGPPPELELLNIKEPPKPLLSKI